MMVVDGDVVCEMGIIVCCCWLVVIGWFMLLVLVCFFVVFWLESLVVDICEVDVVLFWIMLEFLDCFGIIEVEVFYFDIIVVVW